MMKRRATASIARVCFPSFVESIIVGFVDKSAFFPNASLSVH